MWGSPESLQEIKALVTLIENVQLQNAELQASGAATVSGQNP
jgi:hypothetical protein